MRFWGFVEGTQIERAHMQFCKKLLGVKKSTQIDFIYGEIGRLLHTASRHYDIIKYWVKLVHSSDKILF